MILKASQRGGGSDLAVHLLKSENEHIELHELSGFVADDLRGAFKEIQAIAKGTRCKQYIFSLSLSPPETEEVPVAVFEETIAKIEAELGLVGQPRAVVFHEKQGRRHAHCVWSRINPETMTAINLPHFKRKLMTISRNLYLEQGWEMPQGFVDQQDRDPLNFSHAEHGQATRTQKDVKDIKALFKACWEQSDSRAAFASALLGHGYVLAQGDRRGFVAVDQAGEVYAIARWAGVKTKDVRSRLGDCRTLPSIEQALELLGQHFEAHQQSTPSTIQDDTAARLAAYEDQRAEIVAAQTQARTSLSEAQEAERIALLKENNRKLPRGLKAAFAKLTGTLSKIREQSDKAMASLDAIHATAKQALITQQLSERCELQRGIEVLHQQQATANPKRRAINTDLAPPLKRVFDPTADPTQPLIIQPDDDYLTLQQLVHRDPAVVIDVISKQKEAFSRTDVLRKLTEHISDPDQLRIAADTALRSPDLVTLDDGQYSTKDFLKTKAKLARDTERLSEAMAFKVEQASIEKAIRRQNDLLGTKIGASLSEEQTNAIKHVLGRERLASVIGLAGAGKSTMLAAANDAWVAEGYNVIGAALAGKAAEGLQSSSGIESRTLASLEYAWQNGYAQLTSKDVLVIDEAGMVGTRQIARIVTAVRQAGAKLVLVGDPSQLQPIEAGRPFADITNHQPHAKLTEIHRQQAEWQRQASRLLAEGQIKEAMDYYDLHGDVTRTNDHESAIVALTEDYLAEWERTGGTGLQLALAHRRNDVHALNQAIRNGRKASGDFAEEVLVETDHGPRAFAASDRVVFTKNDRELGVKNGSFGTVVSLSRRNMVVRLDGDEATEIRVQLSQFSAVDHGYATTIHKSQGATVLRSFVLASRSLDDHLTYVALTRHQSATGLYGDRTTIDQLNRIKRETSFEGGRSHQRFYRPHFPNR